MEKISLTELLSQSARLHAHLCPRQILGVRMGLAAGDALALTLPQADKRLFTFMETDGCTADGVSVATGCWVGRRTMRVVDFGKIAATFVDTLTGSAIRVHPHPDSRSGWLRYAPQAPDRWHGHLAAYQVMPDSELLIVEPVQLTVSLEALISRPEARTQCEQCGEEIINDRQIQVAGRILCRACSGDRYFVPKPFHPDRLEDPQANILEQEMRPHKQAAVVSIIGRSGVGKTSLLEKLIGELKRRGYRVGTVKHHAHPGFEIDRPGKDSWRHAQAGSQHVVIAAPDRVASIRNIDHDLAIEDIMAGMTDVDIVLTDGYRLSSIPKIEIVRAGRSPQPLCAPEELTAVVTDCDLDLGIPRFDLDDISGLASLIENRFLN